MNGGFWRTRSRSASASSCVFGVFFISTSCVSEPSASIWITRVLPWATDWTWLWFTG